MRAATHYLFFCLILLLLTGGCASHDLADERLKAYQAYRSGDYDKAIDRFELLVKEIPGDGELWFRLGNAYARSRLPKKAVTAYENALLRNPQMAKAWYNMGLIHMQAALKTFADMQEYVPADDPIGNRGMDMAEGLLSLLNDLPEQNEEKD